MENGNVFIKYCIPHRASANYFAGICICICYTIYVSGYLRQGMGRRGDGEGTIPIFTLSAAVLSMERSTTALNVTV